MDTDGFALLEDIHSMGLMECTVLCRIGYRFTTEGGHGVVLDIGSALKTFYLGVDHHDLEGIIGGEDFSLEFSLGDIGPSREFPDEATPLGKQARLKVLP